MPGAAKHVTIAVSGFLSESTNEDKEWLHMKNHIAPSKTGIFVYKWESKKLKDLAIALGKLTAKLGVEVAITLASGGQLSLLKCLLMGSNVTEFVELFRGAKANAKRSGRLLACALAIRFPFFTQTISLVGFSLGCQVLKTCIKTLHKLGATDVLQNVTFMGGAVDKLDKQKNRDLWADILSSQVPGVVKNVYTRKDAILLLYSAAEFDYAIGRNAMFARPKPGQR